MIGLTMLEDVQAATKEVDGNVSADAAAALGPSFSESSLPMEARVMLGGLHRAKAYRRRAARQFELLEAEVSCTYTTRRC